MNVLDDKVEWSGALGSLFVPESVTRSQYVDMHRPAGLSPEQRLMFAVLQGAVLDATQSGCFRRAVRIRIDALAWIRDDGHSGVCSFRGCCELFGFDPCQLRQAVLAKAAAHEEIRFNRVQTVHIRQQMTPIRERARVAA